MQQINFYAGPQYVNIKSSGLAMQFYDLKQVLSPISGFALRLRKSVSFFKFIDSEQVNACRYMHRSIDGCIFGMIAGLNGTYTLTWRCFLTLGLLLGSIACVHFARIGEADLALAFYFLVFGLTCLALADFQCPAVLPGHSQLGHLNIGNRGYFNEPLVLLGASAISGSAAMFVAIRGNCSDLWVFLYFQPILQVLQTDLKIARIALHWILDKESSQERERGYLEDAKKWKARYEQTLMKLKDEKDAHKRTRDALSAATSGTQSRQPE